MKNLLDMNITDVLESLAVLKVKQPITVKEGLEYLMYMQGVSELLQTSGNDIMQIETEYLMHVAETVGGYVPKDVATAENMAEAMLHNSNMEVFFIRLAGYTAHLLAEHV